MSKGWRNILDRVVISQRLHTHSLRITLRRNIKMGSGLKWDKVSRPGSRKIQAIVNKNLRAERQPNERMIVSDAMLGVRATEGYVSETVYKCAVSRGSVTAEKCRELSSDPDNACICRRTQCPVKWRACSKCAEEGTLAHQTTLISRSSGLCAAHQTGEVPSQVTRQPIASPIGISSEFTNDADDFDEDIGEDESPEEASGVVADEVDETPDDAEEVDSVDDPEDEVSAEDEVSSRSTGTSAIPSAGVSNDPVDMKTELLTGEFLPAKKPVSQVSAEAEQTNDLIRRIIKGGSAPKEVEVRLIRRFEGQPRKHFDPTTIRELGLSLLGAQVQPIYLRELTPEEAAADPNGCLYEIVDGERRWLGCKAVEKPTILGVFLSIPSTAIQFAISTIINFGREEHTPIEEAYAIRYMRDNLGLRNEEIARSISKSVPLLYQRLKLLELQEEVQKLLIPNDGSKHTLKIVVAMMLADLTKEHPDIQIEAAQHFVNKGNLSIPASTRYVHGLLEQRGVRVPMKKVAAPEGPVKTLQSLNALTDWSWNRVNQLLQVPDTVYRSLLLDAEERKEMRSILLKVSDHMRSLAEKI